jgi:hypothetical protein
MKNSIPRIRSVKFKNGGSISVLPQVRSNYTRVDLEWGEVTFRTYDGKNLTVADCTYMAELSKSHLSDV